MGEAIMKLDGEWVVMDYQDGDIYTGGGYKVVLELKDLEHGIDYVEQEGWLTVTKGKKTTKVKVKGGCGV